MQGNKKEYIDYFLLFLRGVGTYVLYCKNRPVVQYNFFEIPASEIVSNYLNILAYSATKLHLVIYVWTLKRDNHLNNL